MPSPVRCVNIDWLEVFAMEIGAPHDADYFIRAGFVVHVREYGTRIYNEMFTLDGQDGHPLLEVRRNPKNPLMPSCAMSPTSRQSYLATLTTHATSCATSCTTTPTSSSAFHASTFA